MPGASGILQFGRQGDRQAALFGFERGTAPLVRMECGIDGPETQGWAISATIPRFGIVETAITAKDKCGQGKTELPSSNRRHLH